MTCYLCDEIITSENQSVEHIIPNAIGGRLKSKDLLCKRCNSILGEQYDAKLCNALSMLSGLLEIKREKGENPDIKNVKGEDGKTYNLISGRHPVASAPEVIINKEKNTFHISGRNGKEIKKIVKNLKKKFPNLDDTDLENKMVRRKYYMDQALTMKLNIGGNEFLKGIVKIAINYYLYKCNRKSDVDERIDELRSGIEIPISTIRHYYAKDAVHYVSDKEVSHAIYIRGDESKKLLFAYVEVFSSIAFIVTLNENYSGPDVVYKYTYDLILCEEIDKEINIDHQEKFKEDSIILNAEFIETLRRKLARVISIADRKQVDTIISNIIQGAMASTIGKYPEGTLINEKMLEEFINTLSEEAAPFISHIHSKNQ